MGRGGAWIVRCGEDLVVHERSGGVWRHGGILWGGTFNLQGHKDRQDIAYYEILVQNFDLAQLGLQEKPTKIFTYSYNLKSEDGYWFETWWPCPISIFFAYSSQELSVHNFNISMLCNQLH